jgi:hypothetical protein
VLLAPGPLDVVLRTKAGMQRAARTPEVAAWPIEVTLVEREDERFVRVSVETEASLSLHAWMSPALLAEPRETRWGSFWLQDRRGDHPETAFDGRSFDRLGLPGVTVLRGAPGSPLAGEAALPAGFDAPLHAQVLVRWGARPSAAALSDVTAVRVR